MLHVTRIKHMLSSLKIHLKNLHLKKNMNLKCHKEKIDDAKKVKKTRNKACNSYFNSLASITKNKGQGLIEYLILIALMGVATIGIIRTLNQTIKSRFANAIYALQGRNQKAKTHSLKKEEYQRSDLSNFMSGSSSADKKSKKKGYL